MRGLRRVPVLGVAVAGAAALAACGAGGSVSAPPSTAAVKTAAASGPLTGHLTDPQAGARVTREQAVSGDVTGLRSGDAAWLVVYTVSAPAYWPQKGPLTLDSAGGFRATAVFGSAAAGNIGQHFIVRLVVTSARATARFRTFLADPSQGLSRLPAGVRTLVRETVTRR